MIKLGRVLSRIIIFSIICLISLIVYFIVKEVKPEIKTVVTSNINSELKTNEEHDTDEGDQEFKVDVKKLYIELNKANLIIKKGHQFKIDNNSDLEINQNLDELVIKDKNKSVSSGQLIITLDQSKELDILNIKSDSGVVKVFDVNVENLVLEQGMAIAVLENVNVDNNTKINGGVASLNIKNTTLNNAEIILGTGSFNYIGKFRGVSSISNGVGSVFIKLKDGFDNYHFDVVYGGNKVLFRNQNITTDWQSGNGSNILKIKSGIGAVIVK